MERNLRPPWRLSWRGLITEAKARRNEQGLSQRHLAALADVSQPTLSRFELGKADVQLSSVLKILDALGMLEERLSPEGVVTKSATKP